MFFEILNDDAPHAEVHGISSVPQFSHKVLVSKISGVELYNTNDKSLENSWNASARRMSRSHSSKGGLFRLAAQEHPKSRLLYAVRDSATLTWWESTASSVEGAETYECEAQVHAVLAHKKLDEVAVVQEDGTVHLFDFASKQCVSSIRAEGGKLQVVWSGLYSVGKVAHVLLLVFDAALKQHFLRVIRLSLKRSPDTRRDYHVLEHVCAHPLMAPPTVPPSKSKKKKNAPPPPRVLQASFDGLGLVLSCVWSTGLFCSYRFEKAKRLALAQQPEIPEKSYGDAVVKIAVNVLPHVRLVKFKENFVCFVVKNQVAVLNTLYGSVVGEVLTLPIEEHEGVVSFQVASNHSFFLLATASKLLRLNMPDPENFSLIHCIGAAGATAALFGPQSQDLEQGDFVLDFAQTPAVTARPLDTSVAVPPPHELEAFLEKHRRPGHGYASRGPWPQSQRYVTSNFSKKRAHDRYRSLSPDFLAAAVAEYLRLNDWQAVRRVLAAQLCGVPPVGLVQACIDAAQTEVLCDLVELYEGLSPQDLNHIAAYALSSAYVQPQAPEAFTNQLVKSLVCHQRISFQLDALSPQQLQALFKMLVAIFKQHGLLSRLDVALPLNRVVEWLCAVLDSSPQTFALDPEMRADLAELQQLVEKEVGLDEALHHVYVALNVVQTNDMRLQSEQMTSDYSIEFFP